MKTLNRCVSYIDIIGIEPKIRVQNSTSFKTFFGGILSLLIILLTLSSIGYFGLEIFLKEFPSVIYSKYFDKDPYEFNLTNSIFNFNLQIEDSQLNIYNDPSIVNITFRQTYSIAKPNVPLVWYEESLRLEQCNLTRHYPYFQDLFSNQDLKHMLCLHPDDQDKISLKGYSGTEDFRAISVDVLPCKNNSISEIICRPKEEIDHRLSGGYFGISYIDNIFDFMDYSHPQKQIRRDSYTSLSNNFFKSFTLFLSNVDAYSDLGYLTTSYKKERYIVMQNEKEVFDFRKDSESIFSFQIKLSNFREIYNRRYMKIQDIIAQIGGLYKGMIIIGTLINKSYCSVNFNLFLINEVYNLKDDKEGIDVVSRINLHKKNASAQIMFKHPTHNVVPNSVKSLNIGDKKLKKLNLNSKEKFYTIICCSEKGYKNGSIKLYHQIMNSINNNMDIVNILKSNESDNVLKRIIFSKEQLKVYHKLCDAFLYKNEKLDNFEICEKDMNKIRQERTQINLNLIEFFDLRNLLDRII